MRFLFLVPLLLLAACAPSEEKPQPTVTVTSKGLTLEVATGPDGRALQMDQWQGYEYCKKRGSRLPTVRELIDYAVTFGALGLVPSCRGVQECNPMVTSDNETDPELFFYSTLGYKPAADLRGENWFWATSFRAVIVGYPIDLYNHSGKWQYNGTFRFNGRFGTFDVGQRTDVNAVLCVK